MGDLASNLSCCGCSFLIKLYVCFLLQLNNKLKKEAEARGAEFKVDKLRRNIEMDEYDLMHWRRSLEEKEALIRYISWYSSFSSLKHSLHCLTSLNIILHRIDS